MDVQGNKFQWFFTFIGKNAQTRLVGFTTALILFLSAVVWFQWRQHLSDDRRREEISANETETFKSLYYKECDRHDKLLNEYKNYILDVYKDNDSVQRQNAIIINELKNRK